MVGHHSEGTLGSWKTQLEEEKPHRSFLLSLLGAEAAVNRVAWFLRREGRRQGSKAALPKWGRGRCDGYLPAWPPEKLMTA